MRIGLFIDTFYPMIDGVISVVDNYAKELLKYGEVIVFCPLVDKTEISDKPYKVVQCRSLSLIGFDYSLPMPQIDSAFKKELNASNLDIVHIHSPFTIGSAGVAYAKKHKIPVVATLHSQYKQDFERAVKLKLPVSVAMANVMRIFNSCDECYTVNEDIKRLYLDEYKLTVPCKIIFNATGHQPVENPEESAKRVNERFKISPEVPLYLFVGRLNYLKGIDLIAKSLKILKDKGFLFKMIYVGFGQDEEKLKRLVSDLQLDNCVIFAGKIKGESLLKDLYSRAKLFLFPSLYDTNSLVQIEAAAQSTPTLFVHGAKTASYVKENHNGFFAKNTPESYAEQILRIENDNKLYQKVSKGAKDTLYVSWESTVARLFKKYQRLCVCSRRKRLLYFFRKGNRGAKKVLHNLVSPKNEEKG